ncbi:MAG: phasin family protein [Pseudomonadota bacterium]|nr:phasin family protein [Pseudomonadota bacterium]
MSSKHSGRSSARQASGHDLGFLSVLTEIGRQQLAVASESTSAMYRGSEALRKVQQETAHEASVRHAKAAEKLFSPCQPADMVALQTELMRSNMQSATHYWQELATVALQTHREMMLSMSHLISSDSGSGMKSAMDAFQAVIPPMATSFFVHTPDESSEPH